MHPSTLNACVCLCSHRVGRRANETKHHSANAARTHCQLEYLEVRQAFTISLPFVIARSHRTAVRIVLFSSVSLPRNLHFCSLCVSQMFTRSRARRILSACGNCYCYSERTCNACSELQRFYCEKTQLDRQCLGIPRN